MADISVYLRAVLKAIYGKDVRQSIHDAIDAVNRSAEGSALVAEEKARTASVCAYNAKMSEQAVVQSVRTASVCAYNAKMSEQAVVQSVRTASVCAYNARRSEQTTREMASIARSWAEGTDGEVRKGDEVNNSKYHSLQSWKYAELARKYCEKVEQAGYKTRGSYDDTVTYDYPDIVFYDGSSYVAKKETMGNAPENNSEYWQIFASGLRGTIDYRDLENKPKINGKVLSGDDGLADLGIMQPDWSESDDASNAFIQNKPDLKAVATSGKYTDLEGRPELKEVATSGSYNDLKDRPTIPSIAKNGRLIIQRNGAEIQTFTADQGTDATANILVPTISSSAAITQTGQMALDAIEKNASIEGTLAYQIAQQNGNLSKIVIYEGTHNGIDISICAYGKVVVYTVACDNNKLEAPIPGNGYYTLIPGFTLPEKYRATKSVQVMNRTYKGVPYIMTTNSSGWVGLGWIYNSSGIDTSDIFWSQVSWIVD